MTWISVLFGFFVFLYTLRPLAYTFPQTIICLNLRVIYVSPSHTSGLFSAIMSEPGTSTLGQHREAWYWKIFDYKSPTFVLALHFYWSHIDYYQPVAFTSPTTPLKNLSCYTHSRTHSRNEEDTSVYYTHAKTSYIGPEHKNLQTKPDGRYWSPVFPRYSRNFISLVCRLGLRPDTAPKYSSLSSPNPKIPIKLSSLVYCLYKLFTSFAFTSNIQWLNRSYDIHELWIHIIIPEAIPLPLGNDQTISPILLWFTIWMYRAKEGI